MFKRFLVFALLVAVLGCLNGFAMADDADITLTDMAGREITIPANIQRVCATGQPGAVLLYTLCADKLIAWNSELDQDGLAYFPSEIAALPVIGTLQGGKTSANPETVIALAPDIIVYMTTVTKNTAKKADELQALLGIPVLTVNFDIQTIGKSYRFLGGALGYADRAETLATFCEEAVEGIKAKAATIPDAEKRTFYYAAGGNGLQTAPQGSSHTEMIELVGGINVVDLPAEANGRLKVDMERILTWKPDVIIASDAAIAADVKGWQLVEAAAAGKVYSAPSIPFSWLDAPASVNRFVGLYWVAQTLYPDVYDFDLPTLTKSFYSLFYGVELSDSEAEGLLAE